MITHRLARVIGLLLAASVLVVMSLPALARHGDPGPTVEAVGTSDNPEDEDAFAFSPDEVTINEGENLVFDNTTGAPHTLSVALGETDGGFDSGLVMPFGMVIVTTKHLQPGTYDFFCRVHPFMDGELRVNGG